MVCEHTYATEDLVPYVGMPADDFFAFVGRVSVMRYVSWARSSCLLAGRAAEPGTAPVLEVAQARAAQGLGPIEWASRTATGQVASSQVLRLAPPPPVVLLLAARTTALRLRLVQARLRERCGLLLCG